ncbi:hypothetical protein SRABI05_00358 [Agrobacterium fabrum]|uniref:hypothetical protein n=1 Tax=Agrobacterium fabrum TaxID=1176649 RepID=UPI001DF0028E|nr:hypothetical protein [Agrobacterium fabrum]CAH0143516.1 hypothetical protein SRABI05_00358 [Agrobacterium fabrum]CAH0163068.1 hypothetical protein SRABI46_01072 [Agrobacterium fabrum]
MRHRRGIDLTGGSNDNLPPKPTGTFVPQRDHSATLADLISGKPIDLPLDIEQGESLAEVYGMARVPVTGKGSAEANAEAETQAEENCDQAAEQFAQARGKSRHSLPYTLACVRLAASVCSF